MQQVERGGWLHILVECESLLLKRKGRATKLQWECAEVWDIIITSLVAYLLSAIIGRCFTTVLKSTYSYTMKSIIQDKEKTAERKAELEAIIVEWEEALAAYSTKKK